MVGHSRFCDPTLSHRATIARTQRSTGPRPRELLRYELLARRADPERIHQAKRAGTLASLVDQHRVPRDKAEALIAAWEVEAEDRELARADNDYWSTGQAWMLEQRA